MTQVGADHLLAWSLFGYLGRHVRGGGGGHNVTVLAIPANEQDVRFPIQVIDDVCGLDRLDGYSILFGMMNRRLVIDSICDC